LGLKLLCSATALGDLPFLKALLGEFFFFESEILYMEILLNAAAKGNNKEVIDWVMGQRKEKEEEEEKKKKEKSELGAVILRGAAAGGSLLSSLLLFSSSFVDSFTFLYTSSIYKWTSHSTRFADFDSHLVFYW